MRIYLIRHGEFNADEDVNRANVDSYLREIDGPLTERGITQVSRLVDRIISEQILFDRIYSSRQNRAIQSADTFAETHARKSKHEKGDIVYLEDLVEAKSGEEPYEVVYRMRKVIDTIKSDTIIHTALIFSHSHAIRDLLNSIAKDIYRTILPHCGIALLDYSGPLPKILEYDPKLHLEGMEKYGDIWKEMETY